MLLRKLLRDLGRQRGQVLAVAVVMGLGIALFVTSAASYLDLRDSYAAVQRDLRLADLTVAAAPFGPDRLAQARHLPGIQAAASRTVVERPVVVPGKVPLMVNGRFISLEGGRLPSLDKLLLVAGSRPTAPFEVLVEQHFATYHHLTPGSWLQLEAAGARGFRLRVAGIAVSPEYLWVSRSRSDPMPTPTEFGVFWLARGDLAAIARRSPRDSLASADPRSSNELLCLLAPGASEPAVQRDLKRLFSQADITPRSELPGLALLQMDLDGLRGMALLFPIGFLLVAAFVAGAVQGRLIDAQRATIGTLLALGMPRRTVLAHYLSLAFLPGAMGTLVGTALGLAGSAELASEYARELGIPAVTVHAQPSVILTGLAIGLAVSALAGGPGAWKAAGMAPAEAMRPPRGRGLALLLAASRGITQQLPLALALPLRNLMRRPIRALLTAGGIACALMLVFVTGATVDGTESALRTQIDRSECYDLRADFYLPRPVPTFTRQVRGLKGVHEAEVALTLPVELIAGRGRRRALLSGIGEGRLMKAVDFAGHRVEPAPGQIVVARSLATRLGVTPGASLRVRSLVDHREVPLVISALSDSALGGGVTMRLADAGRAFGGPGLANTALITCSRADLPRLRAQLQGWPALARIQDRLAFRDLVGQLTGLAFALVGAMLLFAAILAAAILFNTATVSVLERARELATLRALGMPFGTLAAGIVLEHALLAILAFAMGLPAGVALAQRALALYDSDLFSLPFVLSARTMVLAFAGVLLVLGLALWPNLRTIARANLAQGVREGSG